MSTPTRIILMGPQGLGIHRVGQLLAEQLDVPYIDTSKLAKEYYAEAGHDEQAAEQAWKTAGLTGYLRYQAPFEVYALAHLLQREENAVVVLGATQVALQDETLVTRVKLLLQPYPTRVLLLPTPDHEESIRYLDERERVIYDGVELNEHFVRHHSNHDLAKLHIYTQGKTPEESCAELMAQLNADADEVFLIGPIGAGKSTLGKLLAETLGRPQISLDKIRWDYYKEIGYDEAEQQAIGEREGFVGVYRYWKRFEAHAVERALQDHPGTVIDFGAGHSVHENEADFARVQTLLAPHPNVAFILPSPDLEEAVAILRERNTPKVGDIAFTRYQVTHPAFHALATHRVYIAGHTPEESCQALLQLLL